MDNTLQTSFIPKQTIVPKTVFSNSSPAGSVDLFTLLSLIILLLSGLIAGGAFGYKSYLQSYIYGPCAKTAEQARSPDTLGLSGETNGSCGLYLSLEDLRRRLDSERLSRMERLDTKMKVASDVLYRHMSLVPLFDFLSTSTLKTIRYTRFETSKGQVSLDGIASGYEDIAVQSSVLNRIPEIKDAVFSNLDLDQKGNVVFKLTFRIDPELLKYSASINKLD